MRNEISNDGVVAGTNDGAAPASAAAPLVVAQLSTPTPPQPEPVPQQQVQTEEAERVTRIVARDGETIVLPEGTVIDPLEIEGNDIVLRQPDGSIIVIENGVALVPTIQVGEIVIAADTLAAALQGVAAAAGAEGAAAPGSSGADFGSLSVNIGDGLDYGDLLPPTFLAFAQEGTPPDTLGQYRRPEFLGGFGALTLLEPDLDPLADPGDLVPGRTTGNNAAGTGETQQVFGLSIQTGTLPLVIGFTNPAGIVIQGARPDTTIQWILSGDGQRLEGYITGPAGFEAVLPGEGPGEPSIVLQLTRADGSPIGALSPLTTYELRLTVTLGDNFPHADGDGSITLVNVGLIAFDGFNAATAPVSLTIVDDVPAPELDNDNGVSLVHDESLLAQSDADDQPLITPYLAAMAKFADVANKGSDPDSLGKPLGFAKSKGPLATLAENFGADGPAGEGAVVWSLSLRQPVIGGSESETLSTEPLFSGVQTTEGDDIFLFLEGDGIVVGRVGGAEGPAAFAVYVDPDTGETYLAQWLSIYHPKTDTHDDEVFLGAGLIDLVATVTDGDNDSRSVSTDISGKIGFQDDGPVIKLLKTSPLGGVTHDESDGVQVVLAQDNAAKAVKDLFLALNEAGLGVDPDMKGPGFAIGKFSSVVLLPYFGTDGAAAEGSVRYALSLHKLDEEPGPVGEDDMVPMSSLGGVPSGLTTTEGQPIELFEEGGFIVGRIVGGEQNAGKIAFAIAVTGDGKLAIAQYVSIFHGDSSKGNELAELGANLYVRVTLTDGDGDTTTAETEVSNLIGFRDDAPTARDTVATGIVDDEGQPGGVLNGPGDAAGAATSVSGKLDITPGADGIGSIVFAENVVVNGAPLTTLEAIQVDAAGIGTKHEVTLTFVEGTNAAGEATGYAKGGTLFGKIAGGTVAFTLEVDSQGNYKFTALLPLAHPVAGTEDELNLAFDFTLSDGDGDPVTRKLTVTVDDDSPSTTVTQQTGIFIDANNTAGQGFKVEAFVGATPAALTKVPGSGIGVVGSTAGQAPAEQLGHNPTTGVSERIVVTFDQPMATVTVQIANLFHADGGVAGATEIGRWTAFDKAGNQIDSQTFQAAPNQSALTLNLSFPGGVGRIEFTAEPYANPGLRPNDSSDYFIRSITAQPVAALDDEDQAGGNQGGPGDDGAGKVATGKILFQAGADGLKQIEASLATQNLKAIFVTPAGFGEQREVTASWTSDLAGGGTLKGVAPGIDPVFTLVIKADGSYTLTMFAPLVHPLTSGGDFSGSFEDNIELLFGITIEDGDGDKVPGQLRFNVDDDSPVAVAGGISLGSVFESELGKAGDASKGTQFGNPDDKNGVGGKDDTILTGTLKGAVAAGADGLGAFSLIEGGPLPASLAGLTSKGETLVYSIANGVLTATAGGRTVFTFEVKANGDYTFTLKDQLDHSAYLARSGPMGTWSVPVPLAGFDAPGESVVVPQSSGSTTAAFLGRLPDNDAVFRIDNAGGTERTFSLVPSSGSPVVVTVPANASVIVNVGPVASGGNWSLLEGATVIKAGFGNAANTPLPLAPTDEIVLDFGGLVRVTDGDGDAITLGTGLRVKIVDDAPIATKTVVTRTIQENDIDTGQAVGSSPNDGTWDGSSTGNPMGEVGGPARVTGSLASLVVGGADEGYTFEVETTALSATLLGLKSEGAALQFKVDAATNTFTGYVPGEGGAADRIVFTFTVNKTNGNFVFDLFDNLDHTSPNGTQLVLDLSTAVSVRDFDGDVLALQGGLLVTVRDDRPFAKDTIAPAVVDDEGQTGGIAGGPGDTPGELKQVSGQLDIVPGADGIRSIVFAQQLVVVGTNGLGLTGVSPLQAILLTNGVASTHDVALRWVAGANGAAAGASGFEKGGTLFGEIDVLDVNGNKTVAFTLTVDSTGKYVYTAMLPLAHEYENAPFSPPSSFEDSLLLKFRFTVTDGDGDTDSATLTVRVDDDSPTASGSPVSAEVSESAIESETTLGTGRSRDDANASNGAVAEGFVTALVNPGADGIGKFEVEMVGLSSSLTGLKSGGSDLVFSVVGNTLVANAATDNRPVFRFTVDPQTGKFTFELLDGLDHPLDSDELTIDLGSAITFYDGDGDRVELSGGVEILVRDDKPEVAPAPVSLASNGHFAGAVGAPQSWGILADTLPGWTLTQGPNFEVVNDGYLGMSVGGSAMLDLGGSPGNIWVAQTLNGLEIGKGYAIQFQAGAPFPDTALLQVWFGGQLIGTVQPGNSMASYAMIVTPTSTSATLEFREVGNAGDNHGTYIGKVAVLPVAFVDEDGLDKGNAQPAIGDIAGEPLKAIGSLGITWGADATDTPDGVLQDTAGRKVVFTGTAVEIAGASTLTSGGVPVTLSLSQGDTVLEGKAGDTVVFRITLFDDGAGRFEFELLGPLDHAPGANENDITLRFGFKAVDFDGDEKTGSFLVGIDDDSPIVSGVTYGHETNLLVNPSFDADVGIAPGNWATRATIPGWTQGSDGVPFEVQVGNVGGVLPQDGSTKIELDSHPNNNNSNATIQQSVTTVAGQAYELTFWYAPRPDAPAGSSAYKVLWNGLPVTPVPTGQTSGAWTQFKVVVTASGTSSTVGFQGDGPADTLGAYIDNVSLKASAVLDDEDQAGGIQGGPGDDGAGKVATGKIDFHAGADGLKQISAALTTSLAAIFVDAAGFGVPEAVSATFVSDGAGGGTLTGSSASIANVFTLVVKADGSYTLTLNAPLAHAAPGVNGPASFENNLDLAFTISVEDKDGDIATGSIGFNVDDDSPVAAAGGISLGSVFESELGKFGDGSIGTEFGADGTDNSILTGTLKGAVAAGADGLGAFSLIEGGPLPASLAGLTSKGETLVYGIANGVLTATAGGRTVFTFEVKANGDYTFTLKDQLDHSAYLARSGPTGFWTVPVPLTGFDAPGEQVVVPLSSSETTAAFLGRLPDNDAVIRVDNAGGTERTFSLVPSSGSPVLVTVPANASVIVNVGPVASGGNWSLLEGATVIKGNFFNAATFPIPLTPTDEIVLDFGGLVRVTDGDGDAITLGTGLRVKIVDDVPKGADSGTDFVVESRDAAGFVKSTATGQLVFHPGADEEARVTDVTIREASGGQRALDPDAPAAPYPDNFPLLKSGGVQIVVTKVFVGGDFVLTGKAGNLEVFTLKVTPTGVYTFDLKAPIDHPDKGLNGSEVGENDVLRLVFDFQVTDADGDTSLGFNQGFFQIDIRDDGPTFVGQKPGMSGAPLVVDATTAVNPVGFQLIAKDAQGNPSTVTLGNDGIGVSGKTSVPGGGAPDDQLGNVPGTNASESLEVVFDQPTNALTIEIARLFAEDNGVPGATEVGRWTVHFLDGTSQTGTFNAAPGSSDVTLNLSFSKPVKSIVFTAEPYANPNASTTDSSDYFVKKITATPAYLDDEDQANGIQGGDGDDGAGRVATGKILFDAGADGLEQISASLATPGLKAILVAADGKATQYDVLTSWQDSGKGGTLVGYVDPVGNDVVADFVTVFELVVAADGSYTLTLKAPLVHEAPGVDGPASFENNLDLAFTIRVEDGDGDVATGSIGFTVDDDSPVVSGTQSISAPATVQAQPIAAALGFQPGADGWSLASFAGNVPPAGLTSGGAPVKYWISGSQLIAYTGDDVIGNVPPLPASQVFKVELLPGSDQWTFQSFKVLDGAASQTATIGGSSSFGTGPSTAQVLTTGSDGTGTQLALLSGWKLGGTFNLANWQAGSATGLEQAKVNGSTAGWGVAPNNNLDNAELLRFDFGTADFALPGAPAFSGPAVGTVNFSFTNFGGGSHTLLYKVHFVDGSTPVSSSVTWNGGSGALTYTAPSGKTIAYVEILDNGAGGGGKVDLETVGITVPGNEVLLQFQATLVDGDGDAVTASLPVSVGATPPPPPVVPFDAKDDIVLTTIDNGSAIPVPRSALMYNDLGAKGAAITGTSGAKNGTVTYNAGAARAMFDPTDSKSTFDWASRDGFTFFKGKGKAVEETGWDFVLGLKLEDKGEGSNRENSGGWTRTINMAQAASVLLSFDYKIVHNWKVDTGDTTTLKLFVNGVEVVVPKPATLSGSTSSGKWVSDFSGVVEVPFKAGENTVRFEATMTGADKDDEATVEIDNFSLMPVGGSFEYSASKDGTSDKAAVQVNIVHDSAAIMGTDKDEILIGSPAEVNTLTGGAGRDVFVLNSLNVADVISDYGHGDDAIDLSELFGPAPSQADIGKHVRAVVDGSGKVALMVDLDGAGTGQLAVKAADVHAATDSGTAKSFAVNDQIKILIDDETYTINVQNTGF